MKRVINIPAIIRKVGGREELGYQLAIEAVAERQNEIVEFLIRNQGMPTDAEDDYSLKNVGKPTQKPKFETVKDYVDSVFKDENTIWFDYEDWIKVNKNTFRKGLRVSSQRENRYLFRLIDEEDGAEVLIALINNDEVEKFETILTIMRM